MQVQTPLLHCAFGPHGDGLHGFDGASEINVIGEQLMNGSPEYPSGQVQAGV